MARPKRQYPIPKLCTANGAFQLRWYHDGKLYRFSLGEMRKQKAENIRTIAATAFAGRCEFPEEIANHPAITRYIASIHNINNTHTSDELSIKYVDYLKTKCQSQWPLRVKYFLRIAAEQFDLKTASNAQINEFLDSITQTTSPATRNRAQMCLSGFYKWLRTRGYAIKHYNPMEGIKQMYEERPQDGIVIWEPKEVKELLKAADKRKDGIGVWIAILAGLRRAEIAKLKWPDIAEAYIIVGKSKTGKKRQVPLSKALAARLAKEKRQTEKVVPWPEAFYGWETAARNMIEKHLPKLLPKIYATHPEKFGWNPFRHTFASRHAQAGLSLDIIAAWMGNTPTICKEHYARYVPKNARDTRIDAADPEL